jgi:transposase-like protein
VGRERDDDVTKPYSEAFKQKMVQRLIGKDAVSANQLSRETGVRQQSLSRWLEEARSLPHVPDRSKQRTWTVAEKARVIAETANLEGDKLLEFLQREGVKLADLERWRLALDDRESSSTAMTKRVRSLERELARKEKALAEAAALLVLKKKVALLYPEEEDDDTDEGNEK